MDYERKKFYSFVKMNETDDEDNFFIVKHYSWNAAPIKGIQGA